MTADGQGQAGNPGRLRIGVVLEAFLDWPLEGVLTWLPEAAPEVTPVTVDDAASTLLRFESGALGTMEVARVAVWRPCDFTVEANGSRGTLKFDYAGLNELWYASADARLYGMRRIPAEHPSHPYAAQWWPVDQGVGYGASFANQVADLLSGWPEEPWTPGFAEGAAVQAVCDAMETSAASGRWVKISEVTNAVEQWEGDLWPGG